MPRTAEQRVRHALANKCWRLENKEKVRAQQRASYQRNRLNCIATSMRYRERNPEQYAESQRRYRANNKHVYRNHGYLRRYGKTIEDYDVTIAAQNGCCALCLRPPKNKRLAWDHCHETGRIRGLLCVGCNGHLGGLGDNEAGLLRALAYVRGCNV